MDLRYETALRNATKAWAQNRVTDHATMQDLKAGVDTAPMTTTAVSPSASTANNLQQPALAQFGNLGTQLNFFA